MRQHTRALQAMATTIGRCMPLLYVAARVQLSTWPGGHTYYYYALVSFSIDLEQQC